MLLRVIQHKEYINSGCHIYLSDYPGHNLCFCEYCKLVIQPTSLLENFFSFWGNFTLEVLLSANHKNNLLKSSDFCHASWH